MSKYISDSLKRIYNFILSYILIRIAYTILSLEYYPIDDQKTEKTFKTFISKYLYVDDPTLDPDLPKAIAPPHYLQLLEQSKQQGKPIKPVKHRKPIDKNISCPHCQAPVDYIYNGGQKYSPGQNKMRPNYVCKICGCQFFRNYHKISATWYCPFCLHKLYLYKKRTDFFIYRCPNKHCPFLITRHAIYKFRDYFFDIHKLQIASPSKAKVNLKLIHYSSSVVGLALVFYINYKQSLRETAQCLNELFNIDISHQTIANWLQSVAILLMPLLRDEQIDTSDLLAIDETYERYKGKWGFLYLLIDTRNEPVLACHFSPKRNTVAVVTTIMAAIKRMKTIPPIIELVHDCYPTYFLAIQLINQANLGFKIKSQPVKGLKNFGIINPYRKYKNTMERVFGTFKPPYYLKRGFSSFDGACSFNLLHTIFYNYFRPHQANDNKPPLLIEGLPKNPIAKWNFLINKWIK
ncbi:MAG TPA: DDE-type integrase/transposase/recombinase [bacterium]